MTANDRDRLRVRYDIARERAARAEYQGDIAGAAIAQGDARRILARLNADRQETVR